MSNKVAYDRHEVTLGENNLSMAMYFSPLKGFQWVSDDVFLKIDQTEHWKLNGYTFTLCGSTDVIKDGIAISIYFPGQFRTRSRMELVESYIQYASEPLCKHFELALEVDGPILLYYGATAGFTNDIINSNISYEKGWW